VSGFDINFNVETREKAETRLTKGYRARRNFLISQLFGMIVYATPVRDGYARGGWHVSVGGRGSTAPRPPDRDGSTTILAGLSALRGQSVFKDVWLNNSVDYIEELERGSSKQAPSGMVRVSLSAFKAQYGDAV